MGSLSDIVINAIFQLWHLIPIVIVIILFKKFIDKKDKKHKINKNEENEKNGLTLELRTVKKYENLGYKIYDEIEDEGIDLVCSKNDKTLLVQCKNNSKSKSITEDDIKTFYTNAIKYIKANNIEKKDVNFRFVIPYKDVLDKTAIKILTDDSYNCKYVIV